jgi:hypothetical protein
MPRDGVVLVLAAVRHCRGGLTGNGGDARGLLVPVIIITWGRKEGERRENKI